MTQKPLPYACDCKGNCIRLKIPPRDLPQNTVCQMKALFGDDYILAAMADSK